MTYTHIVQSVRTSLADWVGVPAPQSDYLHLLTTPPPLHMRRRRTGPLVWWWWIGGTQGMGVVGGGGGQAVGTGRGGPPK